MESSADNSNQVYASHTLNPELPTPMCRTAAGVKVAWNRKS